MPWGDTYREYQLALSFVDTIYSPIGNFLHID